MTRRLLIPLLLGWLGAGCVAIPIEPAPVFGCEDSPAPGGRFPDPDYCGRKRLVIGLFPTVGEARLNGLSTKGMPLNRKRGLLDVTVFPVVIGIANFTGLGVPTAFAWIFEWSEDFDQRPGACPYMVVGYCKANQAILRNDLLPPEGSEPVPGR